MKKISFEIPVLVYGEKMYKKGKRILENLSRTLSGSCEKENAKRKRE